MSLASSTYHFGPFELDPGRRLLAKAGVAVALSPRAFDILAVLVENRDRVLSRTEIMSAVWPDQTVEEHNLSVQMSKLRRALSDSADEGRLIATVPGRGYRFVGAMEQEVEAPSRDEGMKRRRPWLSPRWAILAAIIGLLCAAGLAAWRPWRPASPRLQGLSIVVMPLRDLSDTRGHGYLADAISDDLTTDLSHLPGSVVIARETADSYKAKALPATEIGSRLGVRYLLEGSVRAEAQVLHVNAQLIDTTTGGQIWAERFDAPAADPDQARETIVRRLASVLDLELVSAESSRALRERPNDPDALDLFFRARSILDHGDTLSDFQAAQGLLERAVTMQPGFSEAQAELAAALLRKVRTVDDPTDQADFNEAKAMITRALASAPRSPVALAARAYTMLIEGQDAEARFAAQASLASDPDNLAALSVLAACAAAQGKLDEAASALESLMRLNPEAASGRSHLLQLGDIRLLQGRLDEAIDLLHQSIANDPEPNPGVDSWGRAEGARMLLIGAYGLKGDATAARAAYLQYDRLWPRRSIWRIAATATKAVAHLPGFVHFLGALRSAGMPAFVDEHETQAIASHAGPVAADAFASTPAHLAGAVTLDAAGLKVLTNRAQPLIIDLGHGAAVPFGAVWQDTMAQTQDDGAFADTALIRAGRKSSDPVVVMADGTYGYTSYNVALHLISEGWRRVYWFRGGEEAWAASKGSATDRRS